MKGQNFFTGFLLVIIGVFALLITLDVINVEWSVIWRFWPLIFIIVGIGILPINGYWRALIMALIILAGFMIYKGEVEKSESSTVIIEESASDSEVNDVYDYDNSQASSSAKSIIKQVFTEDYSSENTNAEMEIDFGAGQLNVISPGNDLVFVNTLSDFARYDFNVEKKGNITKIDLHNRELKSKNTTKLNNTVDIALNNKPLWQFNINMGAAQANLDFKPYKVSEIEINGGACKMDITIGDKTKFTEMEINCGVSEIVINIPETASCVVSGELALSGKNLEGFKKIKRNQYQTENYNNADQKIKIDIEGALSNITINRY